MAAAAAAAAVSPFSRWLDGWVVIMQVAVYDYLLPNPPERLVIYCRDAVEYQQRYTLETNRKKKKRRKRKKKNGDLLSIEDSKC